MVVLVIVKWLYILLPLAIGQIGDDEIASTALGVDGNGLVNMVVDPENITGVIDRSDEEWVKYAVLDVAYYLRAHKFTDFDRRFYKDQSNEESLQYKNFPNPPLRYLHWEVNKYCDKDFYDCIAYLQDTVSKAALVRTLDTNVIMNERRWEFPRDEKAINKVNQECLRVKAIDWRDADPFKGPLERFQWRVSASYYMCSFTMQDLSPLTMFGERCDNFAGCLDGKIPFNGDPRADDSKPYQCAMYSFCPEVCCPMKMIQNIDECLDYPQNPCHWQKERSKRQCVFNRELNLDMNAIALNQWNVSCQCDSGYVWESMFGMCIDIDECSTGTHNCTRDIQTCLNLQGHYACVCTWGYINVTDTCMPNNILTDAMEGLHKHYHLKQSGRPPPFSFMGFLFRWTIGLFLSKKSEIVTEAEPVNLDEGEEQLGLYPEQF